MQGQPLECDLAMEEPQPRERGADLEVEVEVEAEVKAEVARRAVEQQGPEQFGPQLERLERAKSGLDVQQGELQPGGQLLRVAGLEELVGRRRLFEEGVVNANPSQDEHTVKAML